MRRSATSSDSRQQVAAVQRGGVTPRGLTRVLAGVILIGALTLASPVLAKVFMTQDEALKLAFPGKSGIKRQTAFLTDDQASAVEKLSGEKPPSRVITWYVDDGGGSSTGGSGAGGTGATGRTVWFDSHVVRTLPETIMVVVSSSGTIERIDILSFNEPEEYLPRAKWSEQLEGRALDDDLSLRRGVRPITGATLSARAIVAAARRVLALRQVIAAAPRVQGGKP